MKKAVYFDLFDFIIYVFFLIFILIKNRNIALIIVIILEMILNLKKIILSIKNNKNKKELMKNGKKIRINISVYLKSNPSSIMCKGNWNDPVTNLQYTFKSDRYLLDSRIIYPNKLDVYIDESNPKKYYMAFEEEKNNQKEKTTMEMSKGPGHFDIN